MMRKRQGLGDGNSLPTHPRQAPDSKTTINMLHQALGGERRASATARATQDKHVSQQGIGPQGWATKTSTSATNSFTCPSALPSAC